MSRLIGATVPNIASAGITRRGLPTDRDTGSGIAIAASTILFFGRTGAWLVWKSGLIAGLLDRDATHTRGSVVDHAVRIQEDFAPGFRADETHIDEEMYRLSDQVIEALNGNLDHLIAQFVNIRQVNFGVDSACFFCFENPDSLPFVQELPLSYN